MAVEADFVQLGAALGVAFGNRLAAGGQRCGRGHDQAQG
jgi:hypothetical protein